MTRPGSRSSPPQIPVRELARIGPFFALSIAAAGAGSPWRPVTALLDDPGELRRAVDGVADRLGTGHRWIAASLFYQGWAARLTSVYAGSARLCGAVPDLRADLVSYLPRRPGPADLGVATIEALSPQAGWRSLHDQHLAPLADALRGQVRIGRYVLLGNAASALAGSLTWLAGARDEPLEVLLGQRWARPADLAAGGRWMPTSAGPRFRRRTCCGYDRVDQPGRCADCSLNGSLR